MPNQIDPITGEPIAIDPTIQQQSGASTTPTSAVPQIDPEEFNRIKQRLDAFEQRGFNTQLQQPVVQQHSGPTFSDQLKDLETQIASYNSQIDDAVAEGKPLSKLLNERDALVHKRTRMQIKHEDLDPALQVGIQTIDQISDTVTRSGMKYYDLVKTDYEAALQTLPVEQRMNPQMRKAAYNIAVGQNIEKITEAQKEEMLRQAAAATIDPGPGASSRSTGASSGDTIPQPKDVLSPNSLAALRAVGKTPDQYYKNLGYTGWEDFWIKRGKDYFGTEE